MKMKTFAVLPALILSGLLFVNGVCQAKIVTDIVNRQVDVPDKVERILLGEGRLFYAVSLLEGDKPLARIAGWQGDFRKLDAQTYAVYKEKFPDIDNIPLIGETSAESISAEKVLTLQPDIAIFGLSGHGPGKESELVNQLEKAGIPVVFVDFRSYPLKNTLPSMTILGQVLQREEQANKFINFYQDQLKRITDVVANVEEDKKTSVFIELKAGTGEECCVTAGNGNMGDFIDIAGGNNISKPLLPSALGTVNLEKVLASNPKVYIATGTKGPQATDSGIKLGAQVTPAQALESVLPVLTRTGIKELSAIQSGNNHILWHGYYNSPQNILAIQVIAKWLYPDAFADLDPKATMNTLYQEFLAVAPTGTFWLDNVNVNTEK